jgi:hypothetical protein
LRRRRGKSWIRNRVVDTLLDRLKNGSDQRRDKRSDQRWQGQRTMSVVRDRALFEGLVTLDFDFLMSQPFSASAQNLADLLPQSVVGRAMNGHGYFTDDFGTPLCFPEATFEKVLTVLEGTDPSLKAHHVRQRRGDMLRSFGDWVLRHIDDDEIVLAPGGKPVFGIDFLADQKVVMREFLTGMVLAGFMDDWSYRSNTMRHHKRTFGGMPFNLGGGDILIVDAANLEMVGLGDTGATVFLDDQMRTLTDIGVICRDRHSEYSFPVHDQAYFRRQLGDGVCDDLAIIYIGAKYGFSAMMGAFVMDAIDTYDKYLMDLTWGGFDTHLAGRIQKHFLETEDEPLVWDDAIFDLIHFAAKRNDPPVNLSSSHRRLIQIEKGSSIPTVLNHWRFLQGEPVFDIKLGFARVPAREFYRVAWQRLKFAGIPTTEPAFIKGKGK